MTKYVIKGCHVINMVHQTAFAYSVYTWKAHSKFTSRKHAGVGIFGITQGQDEKSKETRQAWIDIIKKDRVVDTDLRRQIGNNSLYVCENHFKKELVKYILGVFIDFYYFCDINE